MLKVDCRIHLHVSGIFHSVLMKACCNRRDVCMLKGDQAGWCWLTFWSWTGARGPMRNVVQTGAIGGLGAYCWQKLQLELCCSCSCCQGSSLYLLHLADSTCIYKQFLVTMAVVAKVCWKSLFGLIVSEHLQWVRNRNKSGIWSLCEEAKMAALTKVYILRL